MAATREQSITYNGITIPGTVSGVPVTIHDVHRVRRDDRSFEVRVTILVHSAGTVAAFAAACAALETALSAPRGALLFTISDVLTPGAGTLLDLDPADNTALNVVARVEKIGTPADSNRSRLYEFTVSGELPYMPPSPGAGQEGLRDFEYDVRFSASRRATLTVRGTYTAQPASTSGLDSRAQYLSNVGGRVTTITTLLTGTWPATGSPFEETYTTDDTDALTRFVVVYKELLFGEKIGALDDPDVRDQQLVVSRVIEGSDSDPSALATRLQKLEARYTASIAKGAGALRALWEGRLRRWVVSNVREASSATRIFLLEERVDYDLDERIITASMTFEADANSTFIDLRVEVTTEVEYGLILGKTWPTRVPTGDLGPTPSYVNQGPKTVRQTVVTTRSIRGNNRPPKLLSSRGSFGAGGAVATGSLRPQDAGDAVLVPISKSSRVVNRRRGFPGVGDLFDSTDEILTEIFELVLKVPFGGL